MFNRFFPIVDTCLSSEDIARQSCAMVPKWRFLRPVFAASRVQHISDLLPSLIGFKILQIFIDTVAV